MKYVASISYGKDSLAILEIIKQNNLPLDRIIHSEIWATDTIQADLPPMVEFKDKADKIILERYGIKVERVRAKVTYEEQFYKIRGERAKLENQGKIYGFPCINGGWCVDRLKQKPLYKATKNCHTYVGIAADEPKRLTRLSDNKSSPLADYNITESECLEICKELDLLSPIYTKETLRGGCWFCHNQQLKQLKLLRNNYPEYWKLLLKWDNDSPVKFKPNKTLHQIDNYFDLNDRQITIDDLLKGV